MRQSTGEQTPSSINGVYGGCGRESHSMLGGMAVPLDGNRRSAGLRSALRGAILATRGSARGLAATAHVVFRPTRGALAAGMWLTPAGSALAGSGAGARLTGGWPALFHGFHNVNKGSGGPTGAAVDVLRYPLCPNLAVIRRKPALCGALLTGAPTRYGENG